MKFYRKCSMIWIWNFRSTSAFFNVCTKKWSLTNFSHFSKIILIRTISRHMQRVHTSEARYAHEFCVWKSCFSSSFRVLRMRGFPSLDTCSREALSSYNIDFSWRLDDCGLIFSLKGKILMGLFIILLLKDNS